MADLQAEIELAVELKKFFNIDLFFQGFYQIRTGIKFAPKVQSTTKIEIKSELHQATNSSNENLYPACILNESGVSKTFLILYKEEEVEIDDQFNFKLSVIVDAQNLTDCFNKMDMQLYFELYFLEKEYVPGNISTMQLLCSRNYKLHFNPRLGLHVHVPILFDYFHLSAVTVTIHGSLLCLIPPYEFERLNVRRTSLFSFLFGQDLSQISIDQLNPSLLDRAYHLHNNICEILLSAYESLQDFFEKMVEHSPPLQIIPKHNHQKCRQKLNMLCEKIKTLDDINTIDNLAHAHIAQCSAENIMLWCQFIEEFGLNDYTSIFLAKEYHLKRVKRLSEGFFLRETSRINLLTNESDTYNDLHELVRNSSYFSRLPHLPIECVEIDGVPDTLPILIEEIYSPVEQQPTTVLSSLDKKLKNEHLTKTTTDDPYKTKSDNKQPDGNEKMNNSKLNCLPISSENNIQLLTNNSSNRNSTSIVHQNNKEILPFLSHDSAIVNPIPTLFNQFSAELTIFDKVHQNINNASKSIDSNKTKIRPNRSSSVGSPYETNTYLSTNSSIRRTRSLSTTKIDRFDSSILPDFLRSTSEKPTNDDISLAHTQNETRFLDSSMKSKVLRASFRTRTNTLNRQSSETSSALPKQDSNTQSQYLITKTDDNSSTSDRPVNIPLDSVLNLALELERTSTESIQRQHRTSTDKIDPLLLNGLTEDENRIHFIEKINGYNSNQENKNDKSPDFEEIKSDNPVEYDRIQTNSSINSSTIEYVVYKEKMKSLLSSKYSSNIMFYSDFSNPVSPIPYFSQENIPFDSNGMHLIVCVHGLDGNSGDLRLIKTYLEMCLPSSRLDFLMSSSNHSSTFDDIDIMVNQLIDEIDIYIERYGLKPKRISFIGHSLGNLIIRASVGHQRFERYRTLLHTYLSLSGPHLGTLFNTSGLVNMGMWLMQKWKKSDSLSQMSFRDSIDPKQTYLYKLSKKPCLEFFKNILLLASPQDRYVPYHSARIEVCKAALKDTAYGSVYVEMISNLLEPILRNPSITFVRYNAFHNIPAGTNNIIGRAAHIAILDSELFVEKLVLISAAKYFK